MVKVIRNVAIIVIGAVILFYTLFGIRFILTKDIKQIESKEVKFVGEITNKYDENEFLSPTTYYIEFTDVNDGRDRIKVSEELYSRLRIGDKFEAKGYINSENTYTRDYMTEDDCKIIKKVR